MRYYLVALRRRKNFFNKLFTNTTIVEGFDLVDCVLFSRLFYHPYTKHVVYALWSNNDEEFSKTIINQMNKFIWAYQNEHKGKCPTMKIVKRELKKILKNTGKVIKENPTYYDIKKELSD